MIRGSARHHPPLHERDDTPRFNSAASLLRWLFGLRRGKAQSYDASGGRSDGKSVSDRGLRIAYAGLAWEAVEDAQQRRALHLRYAENLSQTQIANRLDCSARTVDRLVSRGERAVIRRARELGIMEGR